MSRLTTWMNRAAFSYKEKPYYIRETGDGELQLYQGENNGGILLAEKRAYLHDSIVVFSGGKKEDEKIYEQMFAIVEERYYDLFVEDLLTRTKR